MIWYGSDNRTWNGRFRITGNEGAGTLSQFTNVQVVVEGVANDGSACTMSVLVTGALLDGQAAIFRGRFCPEKIETVNTH